MSKKSFTHRRTLLVAPLALAASIGGMSESARAVVIASPTATASATPFNASFVAANAFNGASTEYASLGQGLNTFIEMNFGSTVTFDRIIVVNRNSGAPGDRVSQSTFTYSNDNIFGGGDATETITHNSGQFQGNISALSGSVTTQFVRWDVDALAPGTPVAFNTGAVEILFLNTPDKSRLVNNVSVINAATSFNANHAVGNTVTGLVGSAAGGGGIEYASQGQGVNTFVDFDMGSVLPLTGFDFIDRFAAADRTSSFNLLFSNDSAFSSIIETRSYNKGGALTAGDVFAPINARYVRWDATGQISSSNLGMNEIIFYAAIIPEPASMSLMALAAGALLRRRRR